MFYLQRNVDQGPVERECVGAALDALGDNMNIAIGFSVTSFLIYIDLHIDAGLRIPNKWIL